MPADAQQFLSGLAAARASILRQSIAAVDASGERILADAVARAPVAATATKEETPGELRESAVSEPAALQGATIVKPIGFSAPFAPFVHENLAAHHAQGEAKFLENAVRAGKI